MSAGRREALLAACRRVEATVRARPEYGHTSHLHVRAGGEVAYDVHLRGPEVADCFSVTKTVVATLVGIAVRERLVPDLDEPLDDLLGLRGTPSQGQTWRHLLTMTRGSRVDAPYDLDTVMALPGAWAERVIAAPRVHPPGRVFSYDNGGFLLLGVALAERVGTSLAAFAERALFAPLGIRSPPDSFFAAGWAGQLVLAVPAAEAVVVVTGDPRFELGPPPTDELQPGWRPPAELVREHLVPVLLGR